MCQSTKLSDNATRPCIQILLLFQILSFTFSAEGDYKLHHTFNFGDYLPDGVGSVVYCPTHSLLLIGGMAESIAVTAVQSGISAWRVLSGAPYYKLVTDYETDVQVKIQIYF